MSYAVSFDPVNKPLPSYVMRKILNDGLGHYNYNANNGRGGCEASHNCDGYSQAFYSNAHQMGCALFHCDQIKRANEDSVAGFLAVCAFTYRNPNTRPPFKLALHKCQSCQRRCFDQLCCRHSWKNYDEIFIDGYGKKAALLNVGKNASSITSKNPNGGHFVTISRWYDRRKTTNMFLKGNEQMHCSRRRRCQNFGAIGKIVNQAVDPNCPFLVPIHHIYSGFFTTDYYLIDNQIFRARIGQRWEDKGILGYAVPAAGLCGANVAVYEFFTRSRGYEQHPYGGKAMLKLLGVVSECFPKEPQAKVYVYYENMLTISEDALQQPRSKNQPEGVIKSRR
ncbi:unnamed protein product [Soboliphyme baturini]|uniref:SCP domain-containing protein n=1 Tax=Soboliphyme baturini TaxID=241478 RepID=A0A183I9M2_9BILA|nr:unnamed protein product [Soboliphyme baturini]